MKRLYALLFVLVLSFTALVYGSTARWQAGKSRPSHAKGRILVQMRAGVDVSYEPGMIGEQVLPARSASVKSLDIGEREGLYVVELEDGVTVEEAIAQALRDPRVEFAEPDYLLYTRAVPNDPHFDRQWGLFNTGAEFGKPGADIGATRIWDLTQGSDDIVAAVIDTGIDINHPDLAANIWVNEQEVVNGVDDDGNGFIDDINGWDFANNDNIVDFGFDFHGTHVAGTLGAVGNNNIGIAGVAWRVKMMALKFIVGNSGRVSDAIRAINYVRDMKNRGVNVRVINASWGGPDSSSALRKAIKKAGKAGILFVSAAGNGGDDFSGDDIDVTPDYPSAWARELSSILPVAALDRADNLADFSNYGRKTVSVAAPGVQILSTVPNGGYAFLNGTSMATPHVAGAAVLMLSREPGLTPAQIRERIVSSAEPVLSLASKTVSSSRMNVFNASTNTAPGRPALGINHISANKKLLTIDGLGFMAGTTQIEINGVPAPKVKYPADYALPGGTLTRITSKLGKAKMDSLFPLGAPVNVTVVDPGTGERFTFQFIRF